MYLLSILNVNSKVCWLFFFPLVWLHKNLLHHLFSHYNFTPHYNFFNIISFIIITIHLSLSFTITPLSLSLSRSVALSPAKTSLSLSHGLLLSQPQKQSLSHSSRSSFSNPSLPNINFFFLKSLAANINQYLLQRPTPIS